MDSSPRRDRYNRRLQVAVLVITIYLLLTSCSSAIEVGDKCEGLQRIGYTPPLSSQDLEDIRALGYTICAQYLEQTGQVDSGSDS